jgi:LPPG:FO 2-phospho-L-lactate transferase
MITVLSGGVGAARFLSALRGVVADDTIRAVVNTGDDTVLHGLAISPDLDTITYTLADEIDPARGWGRRDETWRAMEALGRFAGVRPQGSQAGGTWFGLGDLDLATHLYRTARLAEGARLTTVTAEIAAAFGVGVALLPATDDPLATRVTAELPTGVEEIGFQEYFVRHHHGVAVRSVRFDGAERAALTTEARAALAAAAVVVIAPSNPIVSIGPMRAIDGVDALLASRRSSVVAVSPIVGGAALKGPADRLLRELGHEPSVVGVARLYAPIADALVIDPVDAGLAGEVEAAGMRAIVTPSVMSRPGVAASLAQATLAAAR